MTEAKAKVKKRNKFNQRIRNRRPNESKKSNRKVTLMSEIKKAIDDHKNTVGAAEQADIDAYENPTN